MSSTSNRRQDELERDRAERRRSGSRSGAGSPPSTTTTSARRGNGFLQQAQPGAAGRPAAAVPGVVWLLVAVVVIENAAGWPSRGWSSAASTYGIPPLLAGGSGDACSTRRRADARPRSVVQTVSRMIFLRAVRPGRPGGAAGAAAAAVRALPAPRRPVPRSLHHRPGRVPADQRHRRDHGAAGRRLRRAGQRRADHGRRRRPAAHPGLPARRGLPDLLPGADAAGAVVLARLVAHLPPGPGDLGAGDRAVRRDDDRDPRGAGLPPGAAQRGDLLRRRRPVPGRQRQRRSGWSRCSCRACG